MPNFNPLSILFLRPLKALLVLKKILLRVFPTIYGGHFLQLLHSRKQDPECHWAMNGKNFVDYSPRKKLRKSLILLCTKTHESIWPECLCFWSLVEDLVLCMGVMVIGIFRTRGLKFKLIQMIVFESDEVDLSSRAFHCSVIYWFLDTMGRVYCGIVSFSISSHASRILFRRSCPTPAQKQYGNPFITLDESIVINQIKGQEVCTVILWKLSWTRKICFLF